MGVPPPCSPGELILKVLYSRLSLDRALGGGLSDHSLAYLKSPNLSVKPTLRRLIQPRSPLDAPFFQPGGPGEGEPDEQDSQMVLCTQSNSDLVEISSSLDGRPKLTFHQRISSASCCLRRPSPGPFLLLCADADILTMWFDGLFRALLGIFL